MFWCDLELFWCLFDANWYRFTKCFDVFGSSSELFYVFCFNSGLGWGNARAITLHNYDLMNYCIKLTCSDDVLEVFWDVFRFGLHLSAFRLQHSISTLSVFHLHLHYYFYPNKNKCPRRKNARNVPWMIPWINIFIMKVSFSNSG